MKKNFSTPGSSTFTLDRQYVDFERMRGTRSHADLSTDEPPASTSFSRTSSLADLAYVALPGLTSRVSRNNSVVSLAHLGDAFSDMPANESPLVVEGGLSRPLVQSVAVALLSTLLYGYNNGNMNTPALSIRATVGIPSFALTPEGVSVPIPSNDTLWGFVISIFCLGALVGCNSSSQLADRWGRKTFLLWNSMIFVVGGLLEASACLPDCASTGGWQACTARVGLLIAGRAITGIACGGSTVVVPIYLGEISPAHLRGTLGTLMQLTCVIGMLGAQVLGLPTILGSFSTWPVMLAMVLPIALLQMLMQPMLLESPRWYAMYGNERMAEEQLVLLRDRDPTDEGLAEELYCMLTAVTPEEVHVGPHSRTSSFTNLSRSSSAAALLLKTSAGAGAESAAEVLALTPTFTKPPGVLQAAATNPAVRRAIAITLTLMALQQFSGINNAFNFSTSFLKQNGLSDDQCAIVAVLMNVCNVIVTIVSVLLMDKVGRRPLLIFSVVVMAGSTAVLCYALALADSTITPILSVLAILGFVLGFGIGLGPVPGLLPAELFPRAHRGSGSGLAWSCMWFCNFVSAQLFLTQANTLKTQAFLPHLVVLVVGLLFALAMVPETRGKSLEQIEKEMALS